MVIQNEEGKDSQQHEHAIEICDKIERFCSRMQVQMVLTTSFLSPLNENLQQESDAYAKIVF
jgi:hypothetical protein